VTKGFGPDAIAAAATAGCAAIGENYAQELLSKLDAVETAGVDVHFVGRLQSNKVRRIAEVVTLWESIDRPALVDELARRCPGARVLVQVAAAAEPGRGGCRPPEVPALVERATAAGLQVEGLMTIGPLEGGPEAARPAFRLVRRLADELGLAQCSMGMSADLEVAVEEGSTEVRLGTALFGARP
jgi:PLP dependent protein